MSIKLRDLIRSVRSCKTAAEERSVISRESAMIRTAIREEQEQVSGAVFIESSETFFILLSPVPAAGC